MHCPKSEETEIFLEQKGSETLALSEHSLHFTQHEFPPTLLAVVPKTRDLCI